MTTRRAQMLAQHVTATNLAQSIAMTAHMIGRMEEALALEELPVLDGRAPPSREVLAGALAEARALLAILRGRLS